MEIKKLNKWLVEFNNKLNNIKVGDLVVITNKRIIKYFIGDLVELEDRTFFALKKKSEKVCKIKENKFHVSSLIDGFDKIEIAINCNDDYRINIPTKRISRLIKPSRWFRRIAFVVTAVSSDSVTIFLPKFNVFDPFEIEVSKRCVQKTDLESPYRLKNTDALEPLLTMAGSKSALRKKKEKEEKRRQEKEQAAEKRRLRR